MIKFHIDTFTFLAHIGEQPENFKRWVERSGYSDLKGLDDQGTSIYIGIEEADKWEMTIVAFKTEPVDETFFHPELFYISETKTLFIGAGKKALTYSLGDKAKLTDRNLAMGFWYWSKHDSHIILVGELELAVYDYTGNFIWATRAEPPWSYGIAGNILKLDIMDNISKFDLNTGTPIE